GPLGRLHAVKLLGEFRLLLLGLARQFVQLLLLLGPFQGFLGKLGLLLGDLGGLRGGVLATGHLVGEVLQGVGGFACGLGLLLGTGLLRLGQRFHRLLLLGLSFAGANLLRLLGDLLLLRLGLRGVRLRRILLRCLLGVRGDLRLLFGDALGLGEIGLLAGHLVGEFFQGLRGFRHLLLRVCVGRLVLGGLGGVLGRLGGFSLLLRGFCCGQVLRLPCDVVLLLLQLVDFLGGSLGILGQLRRLVGQCLLLLGQVAGLLVVCLPSGW